MKPATKFFGLLLPLVLCLVLVGCGAKAPQNDVIEADLKTSIDQYYGFLTITESSIEKSMTEESVYTATVQVKAESQYAVFDLSANMTYTHYDQGWEMSDCVWSVLNYEIVRYPEPEQVLELVNLNEEIMDEYGVLESADMTTDGTGLVFKGSFERKINENATYAGFVSTQWAYNPDTDQWDMLSYEEEDSRLSFSGIEGTWCSKYGAEYGVVTISNYTDTGFDVSCPTYKSNTVHVEWSAPKIRSDTCEIFKGEGATWEGNDVLKKSDVGSPVTVQIIVSKEGTAIDWSVFPPSDFAVAGVQADVGYRPD